MATQNTYTTAPDSNYPRRFPFTFPSLDSSEVYVSVAGAIKTVGASNDYTLHNYNQTSGGYIEFVSDTTRGTGTVRVYRATDGSILKRNFQPGSAIKADDLNTANKQAIYLAEEARQDFTNLATSGTASGFAIDGENIAPDSITSNKIKDLEVKAADLSSDTTDDTKRAVTTNHIRDNAVTTVKIPDNNVTANKLKSSSSTDSDRAVTTNHIRDGAVTDVKLSTISGSKITPDFGSQNITTTGTLNAGTTTTGTTTTGSTTAQDLTVSGNATFNTGISSDGKDVYTDNGALIINDADGAFADRSGSNIDHIWHDDSDNAWNFVSDDPYKATGNSKVKAGSFYGDGSNLTNLLIGVRQVKEGSSTGTSSTTSSSFQTKTSVSLTNTTSSSRVLVISTYRIWSSTPYSGSRLAEVRTTRGNDSTFSGDTYDTYSNSSGNSSQYSPYHTSFLWDTDVSSGTREYKIRYRKTGSGTAYISHARIMAIEFRPT